MGVLVPPDWKPSERATPNDDGGNIVPDAGAAFHEAIETAAAAIREAKDAEIQAWRERAKAAEAGRERAEVRAERAERAERAKLGDDDPLEEPAGFFTWIMAAVFLVPFTLLALLPLLPMTLYRAWVVTWLWEWFAVPVFRVPSLDLGYAFGLSLIVFLFTPFNPAEHQAYSKQTKFRAKLIDLLTVGFLGPTCSLGMGWFVKTVFCSS